MRQRSPCEAQLSDEEIEASARDYLREEIRERLGAGPVVFTLQVQLAEDGDPLEDPTVAWPEEREVVELGRLELTEAIARDSPLAPAVSAFVGFTTAIALAAIHLAPHWGIFSDPYSKLDLGFISWAIVIASIVASLWLGVLGLRANARARPARQAHA